MNRVILARCAQSLDWIRMIPDEFEVVIDNKGDRITSPEIIRRAAAIIERPDLGGEAESFLHHMLGSTEEDDSFTVYASADPFDNSPDFLTLLCNWREWQDLQALSYQSGEDRIIPPTMLLADYELGLMGRPRVRPERFSLTTWGPIDFVDQEALGLGHVYRAIEGGLPAGTNIAAHFLRLVRLEELADQADRHSVGVFSYGGIFAVRNRRVAALPQDALHRMLERSASGVTVYGSIMERLWLHLFGEPFLLPKIAPPQL